MTDPAQPRPAATVGPHETRAPSWWERLRRWGGLVEDGEDGEARAVALDDDARSIIENVLRLRDLTVGDVMVPRIDIVGLEVETPWEEVVATLVEEGHSRMPVFRDDLDHILGMIHVKDVLPYVAAGKSAPLLRLLRKVLFVAPSTGVLDLLGQMRVQRVHMAFVVDEFGGIDGLATIEDLVEEIVGDIEDEHDINEPLLIDRPDGSMIVDARTPIEALEDRLGMPLLPEGAAEEVDTVGGLCFMLSGRVPQRGETIEHPAGLTLEILDADQRRIRRLRIRPHARPTAAHDAA